MSTYHNKIIQSLNEINSMEELEKYNKINETLCETIGSLDILVQEGNLSDSLQPFYFSTMKVVKYLIDKNVEYMSSKLLQFYTIHLVCIIMIKNKVFIAMYKHFRNTVISKMDELILTKNQMIENTLHYNLEFFNDTYEIFVQLKNICNDIENSA